MGQTRVIRDKSGIPTHGYKVIADLKHPPSSPLESDGQPVGPDQILAILPGTVLEQEISTARWMPIPEEAHKT